MKTLLAATLMLATTVATADWEDVFKNPDLSSNYQGHTTVSTLSVDPVAEAFAGNNDLFAGAEAGDVIKADSGPSSLDDIGHRNPDLDCGCI
ncbi:MAG: hypothetical protein AB8G77_23420 [Rhodothermales bacterium]